MSISQVQLTNFRNYKEAKIQCDPNCNIALIGNNGTGKTNILEAISLLSPGKGLRGANKSDVIRLSSEELCVNIDIVFDVPYNIKIIFQNNQKFIKIDNKKCRSFSEILKIINVIWFTPQMSTMFAMEKSARRKFIDRIVASFFPIHVDNMIGYEYAKNERMRLFKNGIFDNIWLNQLEKTISEKGVLIAESRLKALNIIQKNIDMQMLSCLTPILVMEGEIEKMLGSNTYNVDDIQHIFANKLKNLRSKDALIKRTSYGVHLSDFYAIQKEKNIKSTMCSTGEQKLLLISIILASIGEKTILLLDDIMEHVDDINIITLMNLITQKKCQTWISATSLSKLKLKKINFCILEIMNNQLIYA